MKILIIPDSFKGSATSMEVAEAVARGLHKSMTDIECVLFPLADGGEGSLEALYASRGGQWVYLESVDPLLRPIHTKYLLLEEIAYVELAASSGLELLLLQERSASTTSTKGTGLLLADAFSRSVKEVVLSIGGSATNDGGTGIAEHLGYRFLDQQGNAFLPVGKSLGNIVTIVPPKQMPKPKIRVLCDVKNPFTGPAGATYVYGPQKGAKKHDLKNIEAGMRHLAEHLKKLSGIDLDQVPGAGAAGGVGGGMHAFFNASLQSGIEYFIDVLNIEEEIRAADLVVTGEGQLDHQSLQGKLISGVAALCKKHDKPAIAICGALNLDIKETHSLGLTAAFSIMSEISDYEEAMRKTQENIENTLAQIGSLIKTIMP